MNTNQIAEISGVSVRTLHHYDQIGLLCPQRNPENGYREYGCEEIAKLQQILFFRECGFKLEKIKHIMATPGFDCMAAFALQKKILIQQRERIDAMLETLEKTMCEENGGATMNNNEKFSGLNFRENPYEQEAKELYGEETVNKSKSAMDAKSDGELNEISGRMDSLFKSLAEIRHLQPESAEVQAEMENMFSFFNSSFGVVYTPEMFAGIGQMYVSDQRFTKNIDAYGQGLSKFLAESMRIFAEGKK